MTINPIITGIGATFGSFIQDVFQKHKHSFSYDESGSGASWIMALGSAVDGTGNGFANEYIDGGAGTPRTGNETAPASFALIYCMKTTEDATTTTNLFQVADGNISVIDSSHSLNLSKTQE